MGPKLTIKRRHRFTSTQKDIITNIDYNIHMGSAIAKSVNADYWILTKKVESIGSKPLLLG